MEWTDSRKALFIDTAKRLKGSARRLFMARTVQELGPGSQRRAERELGRGRPTIRTGPRALTSASPASMRSAPGPANAPRRTCRTG
jgi:hypothetical protein